MSEYDDDLEGKTIADRFVVGRKIGEGGMGSVYEAEQIHLGRRVAIKVMHPRYALSSSARLRFAREARVASTLRHPNAVEIYDFGEYGATMFLAMRLLHGQSLRSIVDWDLPPIPVERAIQITRQVADVLVAAHKAQLVHRDIKPENIFIERNADNEDRVCVVDFGLSFIEDSEESGRMTREGVIQGTPEYLSPEQARGEEVSVESDIYSLGCVLYEMLTCDPPFQGNVGVIVARHMYTEAKPLRESRPDLSFPPWVEDLVGSMLAKPIGVRPTAEVLCEAIDEAKRRERQSGVAGTTPVLDRMGRMLSLVPEISETPLAASVIVAVPALLDINEDVIVGLAANGILLRRTSDPDEMAKLDAIFAPVARLDDIRDLLASGLPVIADAQATDTERIFALLRAGVDDVVVRPVECTRVALKIQRAIRKHRRRRNRNVVKPATEESDGVLSGAS